MATVSAAAQANPIGAKLYSLTETSSKISDAAPTMATSGGLIIQVEIDNTANSSAAYLNLYDVAGGAAVTVGTTDESFVFKVPAGSKTTYSCPDGSEYANGLKGAIVASPGSSIGPGASVTAYILATT
tara:strand:- start:934 stop:1317 length:384 start_codon:yes stop_codon:yes gene_type:complete